MPQHKEIKLGSHETSKDGKFMFSVSKARKVSPGYLLVEYKFGEMSMNFLKVASGSKEKIQALISEKYDIPALIK